MAIILILPLLWDIKYHDADSIHCGISNYGPILIDFEWPKGSGQYHLFAGGIWFGAIPSDTAVTVGYDPMSGGSEFVPGLCRQGTTAYQNPYVRIYIYPEDWPPPKDTFPMAPDTTLTYEDSWCCLNDGDSSAHSAFPLGIEIYQSGYADTGCPNTIFITSTIKNTTIRPLIGHIGILIDPDIGDPDDDCYSLYRNRWLPSPIKPDTFYIDILPFAYDHDWWEAGWYHPGAVGITPIETPENLGATAVMAFLTEADPDSDGEQFLLLKGIDPKTGDSIGFKPGPVGPGDVRLLLGSGPFQLDPGSTTRFAFGVVFAYDTLALAWQAKLARDFYYHHVSVGEAYRHEVLSDRIATITRGKLMIGSWERIEIYDPTGRLIYKRDHPPRTIDLPLPAGIYFLRLKKPGQFCSSKVIIIH
ncbi:hypothetical protein DRP53_04470 [candidate division WOR-3 bacterium]|uniref:T9SS type A sorting domain-containing protein n=1 Tax=candidate division WOR-3 bacterium TaxID=2052148 RepID=A0A660SJ81_UNCW3|nr:MAG: hypothetical protein DRP53_04470 [candidate division WOR-3 bacterium]